jgi:hypothetical protein
VSSRLKIKSPRFLFLFLIFAPSLLSACQLTGGSAAASASGAPLFKDDFSSSASGWDRSKSAEGVMDYDGGGYRILVNALQVDFRSVAHKDFSDVRVETDAGKLGGPDQNRIGLICRYARSDYYFFVVSSDGYYGIGIFNNGQASLLGQSAMQTNDKIKTGVAVNHLRADCKGSTLSFYVNGSLLAEVHNSMLKSGDVGLLAGTFSQPGVDVIFDHFVVMKP